MRNDIQSVGACEWSQRCVSMVVREALAVARAEQVPLHSSEQVRNLRSIAGLLVPNTNSRAQQELVDEVLRVARDTGDNTCSMLADLRRGSRFVSFSFDTHHSIACDPQLTQSLQDGDRRHLGAHRGAGPAPRRRHARQRAAAVARQGARGDARPNAPTAFLVCAFASAKALKLP